MLLISLCTISTGRASLHQHWIHSVVTKGLAESPICLLWSWSVHSVADRSATISNCKWKQQGRTRPFCAVICDGMIDRVLVLLHRVTQCLLVWLSGGVGAPVWIPVAVTGCGSGAVVCRPACRLWLWEELCNEDAVLDKSDR